MTRHFIGILAAATVLSAIPAFAQDPAAHDAHHPAGEAAAGAEATAAPAAPEAKAPTSAAPAVPAPQQAPGAMAGGMDCMKMMEGMMRGMMTGGMMPGGGMPSAAAGATPAGAMQGGVAVPGGMKGGMAMPGRMGIAGAADAPASTKAYRIAAERMHIGMAADYSGNADADFVRGMIAHHRGAIEMAEVVLEHGQDPEIRRLAEGVIAAQEAEIATMRKWIVDHREVKP